MKETSRFNELNYSNCLPNTERGGGGKGIVGLCFRIIECAGPFESIMEALCKQRDLLQRVRSLKRVVFDCFEF
jgi:hypothetical protein